MEERIKKKNRLQSGSTTISKIDMEDGFEVDLVDALKTVVQDSGWQCLGSVTDLKKNKCKRFYAEDGEDVVLIYVPGQNTFYCMDAACSHEGGPLEQGDIEDFDGELKIVCPWHSYDFDLKTGISSSGLHQEVYQVEVVGDKVYVNYPEDLHTKPCKIRLTFDVGEKWQKREITTLGHMIPPDQPKRADQLNIVAPGKEKRRGKGGSLASRISNLHSLANIEQWAVDLSWDIVVRFAHVTVDGKQLPQEFFDDFIQVAIDEAKHYGMISTRLKALGSHFGALPVHNALWDSATDTSDSLLARLAIVHMVHEARGLDVQPKTLEKFAKNNDPESVKVLEVIYRDEITHVAAGLKWFTYICKNSQPALDCIPTFHEYVKKYFRSYLKPPFNTEGRQTAGMYEEWYMPLVKPK
ncbi:unnamed protein product [Mytilus coruscus]|uniref:Rieske domain-containing protein n=1 Tax=Mytilus coruscus TaxID=42192 RepID=A0A6J8EH33_MYTCO|nr:unnamed protein product [Mytilus coruscus]